MTVPQPARAEKITSTRHRVWCSSSTATIAVQVLYQQRHREIQGFIHKSQARNQGHIEHERIEVQNKDWVPPFLQPMKGSRETFLALFSSSSILGEHRTQNRQSLGRVRAGNSTRACLCIYQRTATLLAKLPVLYRKNGKVQRLRINSEKKKSRK